MPIIEYQSIIVPENRMRREFDEARLGELAESITKLGLLHPPVVRSTPDGYVLVAGERRYRAIGSMFELDEPVRFGNKTYPVGQIPVTLLSDLSPLEVREAELEENVIRVDLSWSERAAAEAELHELRSQQADESGRVQRVADTASEILGKPARGGSITSVTESMILAKHLSDPDVQKAKTKADALKIVRKKAEAAHRQKLAEAFDRTSSPHVLLEGDSRVLMQDLPTGTFSVIITDPPYGIEASEFGSQAIVQHMYADDLDYAMSCYTELAISGFRVAAQHAHLYAFCDIRFFRDIAAEFAIAGWSVFSTPLIWSKGNGMLPLPEHGPRRTYECILFANKGNRRVNCVAPDVISIPSDSDKLHAAQKPVELYAELLRRSALPGDRILDPFCGSGPVFPAAHAKSLVATGIELSPEHAAIAIERIRNLS